VVQIPRIMHLPSSIARTAGVNAEVIGFSTDITPSCMWRSGTCTRLVTRLMGQSRIGPARIFGAAARDGGCDCQ